MNINRPALSAAVIALVTVWAAPASAQNGAAASELAALRAQMTAMTTRIDTLEAQLAEAKADTAAVPAESAAGDEDGDDAKVTWKGATEITGDGGWSFKPRGRIQLDAGTIGVPDGIAEPGTGFASEVRRAFIGVDGKLPGGFGYRAEIDVAASPVEITDLYLTYEASDRLGLTLGHHKPFWGLEEMTSDLFTSFTERAAFNSAFGFERRLGLSASFRTGEVLLQGGAFTDDLAALGDDGNDSLSLDGRAVLMPKLGDGQLHLGGSLHWRDLNDGASSVRYRVRPFIHTPDIRFVDTGDIAARGETGYGLEAGYIQGPFHAVGEAHWQRVRRPGALPDPTFFGGYAEIGLFLTPGDSRGYKDGAFDRVKPANPVGEGGMGALQVNLRYDRLDLSDAGVTGGTQNAYGIGMVWTLTDYVRFLVNYGHLVYRDAAIPAAGGDRDYTVDAFGMRAQVDF